MRTNIVVFSLLIGLFVYSCRKEEKVNSKGEIKFCINNAAKTNLKAVLAGPRLASILVSIENSSGVELYNKEKMELFNFSGNYISNPVAFEAGNYKLTYFAVLDSADNILYAAPIAGSPEASYVEHPLSIIFTVQKDLITYLAPEVLSTENLTPKDFGYSDFSFTRIMTFLISVNIYNSDKKHFEFTNATLTISNGTSDIVVKALDTLINQVPVQEGLTEYYLKVEKDSYLTYYDTLSESELKTKFDDPLTIILEPYSGPIVHYSFSGNVNDESGNDYNGTAYNITYTSDAHGNINSSAQFNGDAYIQLPSDFDLKERTISLMFNCNGFFLNPPYNYTVNNIFTIDHPGLVYGDLYFNILYVGADLSLEFVSNVASSDATNAKYVKININQWYHAVISIDKQYIKYYLNGTISGVYANTNPDYHSSSGTNNVLLGTSRTKANNYFQGKIDDLRIYNRALSAGEILSLYNEMK